MGYLTVIWITVVVLLVVWLLLGWRYRNARLDRLALFDGEKLCFDDDQARYTVIDNRPSRHAPRFMRAIVRVTSERLIVAEPAGRIARLRWAIYHAGPIPDGLGNAWQDGYVSFATSARCVSVDLGAERRVLSIAPSERAPDEGMPARLKIESPRLGDYLVVLGRSGMEA